MRLFFFVPVILSFLYFTIKLENEVKVIDSNETNPYNNVAYFASGCFWCVEYIYESVKGVDKVVSGYSGGKQENANYKAVSNGRTNHAETVAVHYDSTIIDYQTLLIVFFASHDPSTLNKQGPDSGRHYRSAIFYTNSEEKQMAKTYITNLLKENTFSTITTTLEKFDAFYEAEDYHQDYKENNPSNSYIQCVSVPRFEAFKKQYPELLKD